MASPCGALGQGYRVDSVHTCTNGAGLFGSLSLIKVTDTYGPDIQTLRFSVRYETEDRLHVHITANEGPPRWEVPADLIPRASFGQPGTACEISSRSSSGSGSSGSSPSAVRLDASNLIFSYTLAPFGFAVTRRASGEVLFNTTPPAASGGGPDSPPADEPGRKRPRELRSRKSLVEAQHATASFSAATGAAAAAAAAQPLPPGGGPKSAAGARREAEEDATGGSGENCQGRSCPAGAAAKAAGKSREEAISPPPPPPSFGPMVFKDQYLEVSTAVAPGASLFGLGESTRTGTLKLIPGSTYTLWAADTPSAATGVNLYGAHPFYMQVSGGGAGGGEVGSSHGVLLLNSNGMDVEYGRKRTRARARAGAGARPKGAGEDEHEGGGEWEDDEENEDEGEGKGEGEFRGEDRGEGEGEGEGEREGRVEGDDVGAEYLTYRVIGGVLDFFFFAGPSPAAVLAQYCDLIGRPAPMPYWSLGFQQSKYGYPNLAHVRQVVANYSSANLPLEVVWGDIDYMQNWRDFTVDRVNYPSDALRNFTDELHAKGMRYVVIVDPGIKVEQDYPPYARGVAADVFVRDVWPGAVHFPDFLHPAAPAYWSAEILGFHKTLGFDGLWIDMNEPSNFCTGVTCEFAPAQPPSPLPSPAAPAAALGRHPSTECCIACSDANATRWDSPPYTIRNGGASKRPLGYKTVPMSATHHGGVLAYDAHNLYGLAMAKATRGALSLLGPASSRPFVLTRSTFVGSGAHAAHWTGDNAATWRDLKHAVTGVLASGLVGIPMAGADVCGFSGGASEELCARWIQVAAFQPFVRDHAALESPPQELYHWAMVTAVARSALALRYQLLPYFYTLLLEAHQRGTPVARPLFLNFPGDCRSHAIYRQFMVGSAVLVSPVLTPGAMHVRAYFPQGAWYSLFDWSRLVSPPRGAFRSLHAPLGVVHVHIAGGSIVPMQEAALTTSAARKTPFTLVIAFQPGSFSTEAPTASASRLSDSENRNVAKGVLFVDSPESVEMGVIDGSSTFIEFSAELFGDGSWSVASEVTCGAFLRAEQLVLDRIIVLGEYATAGKLLVNQVDAGNSARVNDEGRRLLLEGLKVPIWEKFEVSWNAGV
eukprot:jgi/Mesen1/2193/ME000152S01281